MLTVIKNRVKDIVISVLREVFYKREIQKGTKEPQPQM